MILSFLAVLFIGTVGAQEKADNKQTVVIKTSAECGQCKERIEEKLNYVKGISFAELNYETRELTVKFRSDKITLDEIRKIISGLGYDADEVKADPDAQKKLPMCCQPGGMHGH
ncbi:MAG: Heavy metal transport/detoxification protein [Crocinitomicaceae bacterium]|nr:Heavy metal transport/detoxification protein [Crocinitomicaceae bacterium]